MIELFDWFTKYSPAVVLVIAFGAALLFVARIILEKGITSYVDEKVRALKYLNYFDYAQGILNRNEETQRPSSGLKNLASTVFRYFFERDELQKTEKALGVMAELVRNYPYRTQEIIDEICLFVRKKWNKQYVFKQEWSNLLAVVLRILASVPKKDQNNHPYYVELSGLRVQHIDLKGINFEHFVLWETEFIGVNMTRSNFCKTDLGGCVFTQQTSVEWSDFSGALMNVAYNGVVTTFDRVQLWGSKFEESRIDKCKMIISDGFDATGIKAKFGDRLEVVELNTGKT